MHIDFRLFRTNTPSSFLSPFSFKTFDVAEFFLLPLDFIGVIFDGKRQWQWHHFRTCEFRINIGHLLAMR